MRGEIDILDAEPDAFHEAQPRPIEEACHQMGCAGELGQYLRDFLPCKHDGHPSRFPSMLDLSQLWKRLCEDMTIEEDESLQRDILGGRRHLSLHGEMCEKDADFWGPHVRRVAFLMEENKALSPLHIRLFCSDTQVFE